MEKKRSLFREEAINSRLNRSLGSVRLASGLNYRIVAIFSGCVLLIIVAFLGFASACEKIFVRGFLDTDNGIVSVQAKGAGVVRHLRVEEGALVKKGDVLCVISQEESEKTEKIKGNLQQRMRNLQREYQLKKNRYDAMKTLYEKKYISSSALQQTQSELLEITNKIALIRLESLQYHYRQKVLVKAPVAGRITNILYKTGQSVDSAHALLQIIPADAPLIARLYVPSKDVGFLKKEQDIVLKYDAYPAQRFGVYLARIQEINLTVLTDEKEDKPLKIGEAYYKIKAQLTTQCITVYGKKMPLTHGMAFTAVILGDKKTLWQWIFDPLYRVYGDTFA